MFFSAESRVKRSDDYVRLPPRHVYRQESKRKRMRRRRRKSTEEARERARELGRPQLPGEPFRRCSDREKKTGYEPVEEPDGWRDCL